MRKSVIPNVLDFIGLNAYPSLSLKGTRQSIEECQSGWYEDYSLTKKNHIKLIRDTKRKYNKPVYITETGCQPFIGRLISPNWNSLNTARDKKTQTKFLQSTLPVLLNEEYLDGIYLFDIYGGGYSPWDYDYLKVGRVRDDNMEAAEYIKKCYENGADKMINLDENYERNYNEPYKTLIMGNMNKWTKIGEIINEDFNNRPHCLAEMQILGFNKLYPNNDYLDFKIQYRYVDNLKDTIIVITQKNNKLDKNNIDFICHKTKINEKCIETIIDIYFKAGKEWEDYGYKILDKLTHNVSIETVKNDGNWYTDKGFYELKKNEHADVLDVRFETAE